MRYIGLVDLMGLPASGCARSEPQNAYEEIRESRDQWAEIDRRVEEKREEYSSEFGEITFSGDPDELTDVVLSITSGLRVANMPFFYYFYEEGDQIQLDVELYEEGEDGYISWDEIQESLVVDDIEFEDGTYTVTAEEYTFKLHMFQDSVRRLRDDSGEMLMPSYYVPEELKEQWRDEATEEVESSD